jgi:hypothetical protein
MFTASNFSNKSLVNRKIGTFMHHLLKLAFFLDRKIFKPGFKNYAFVKSLLSINPFHQQKKHAYKAALLAVLLNCCYWLSYMAAGHYLSTHYLSGILVILATTSLCWGFIGARCGNNLIYWKSAAMGFIAAPIIVLTATDRFSDLFFVAGLACTIGALGGVLFRDSAFYSQE